MGAGEEKGALLERASGVLGVSSLLILLTFLVGVTAAVECTVDDAENSPQADRSNKEGWSVTLPIED